MINKAINLKMLVDFTMSIDLTNYPTNYVALRQINQIVEDGFSLTAEIIRSIAAIVAA